MRNFGLTKWRATGQYAMQTLLKVLGLCALLALHPGAASAQGPYPSRAIKLIVPTTPGATTDVLARVIGQALSQSWGQPVVVENRPGADETLGIELVAKSPADGYTLLVTSNGGITTAPLLHSQLRYDPLKDLTPILMLGHITPVMVVPASVPVRYVQELIAFVKARPGELNYGSFGNGSYSHVAMEDLKKRTGMDIMHIPYRGASPAYTALLRGEILVMIANLSGAAAHADAGNVRIIAAAGAQRPKMRPDLPTVAESGVPGFSTGAWWAVFGPANLPPVIFDKIRGEIARTLATAEMQKVYETNTLELLDLSPAEFGHFIREDIEHWKVQLDAAGIKPN
ncbi:MAG: Bug family tripartite tricarboxylate transporter substrate binding protein [Xanthobacteraceae bacterium]